MTQTLFLDLDDTLIECGIYYSDAIEEGAQLIEKYTGVRREVAQKLIRQLDLLAIEQDGSFAKERFPNSFVAAMCAAYEITMQDRGRIYEAVAEVRDAGWSVFAAPYVPKPGAIEFLEWARHADFRTVLVTKGDHEIQHLKLARHRLSKYFDDIHVVERKDVEVWGRIVRGAKGYVIGDSLKDDIAPTKALDMHTIHIPPSLHWSFNDSDVTPHVRLHSLAELRPYLEARV